jgi:single-stranded-DNA-specific exonuclease
MRNSTNFGINAIIESYFKYKGKKSVSTDVIGFYISPRINAAGRLAKADRAVELFLSENKNAAEIIAEELSVLNRQRQETEKEIFIQAENQLSHIADKDDKKIIILCNDNWNQGVIGIVASKLSEKYNKAFILFAKDAGGVYKGSCRSVRNINITEMLTTCSDILIKYGGHERAAGLSAEYENIEKLEKRLNDYADTNNIEIEDERIYNIECELQVENITCETVRELEILEPFGNDNPVPMFVVSDCKITNIIQIGENKHIRVEFIRGRFSFEAVYFNMEAERFAFNKYDYVDIACNISINEFMNRERVQYVIRDVRINEKYADHHLSEKEKYFKFIENTEKIKINNNDIPNREDFKSVYIFLVNSFKKDVMYDSEYNISKIESKYFDYSRNIISRFKFRIILDIFNETDIIDIKHDFDSIKQIKINRQSNKTDLDNSNIYKRLKELL